MLHSDDDDHEDNDSGREGQDGAHAKRKRGGSIRATARAKGSKRVKAYEHPLPLEYQQTPGGFQKYKLPDDTVVWDRRTFTYSEGFKDGDVETDRPAPPPFFTDKYLFHRAKSVLPGKEDKGIETKSDVLRRRVERRIVQISCGFFIGWDFEYHYSTPIDLENRLRLNVNPNLVAVFGEDANQWTAKQVWAWALPEIALTGDALSAFQAGALALLQSSTHRLLSIYTLGQPELFQKLTGAGNRLETLDGTLRAAAELLRSVLVEGILVKGSGSKWKQRPKLEELLFTAHDAKHGKKSAEKSVEQFEVGDDVKITIFNPTRTGLSQTFRAPTGPDVKVDEYGIFCHNLGETALGKAIERLEIAVSTKTKCYPAARGHGRNSSGKVRHYQVGLTGHRRWQAPGDACTLGRACAAGDDWV